MENKYKIFLLICIKQTVVTVVAKHNASRTNWPTLQVTTTIKAPHTNARTLDDIQLGCWSFPSGVEGRRLR